MSPDLAYQAYKSAHRTVTKTRQIVMLYDAAIRYIQQAQQAITARRIEERYHLLAKAGEILSGLQNSIDFDRGGAVAVALHDYYGSLERKLHWIQRQNDIATCEEVISQLKEMRNAWEKIDSDTSSSSAKPASGAPSSAMPNVAISA
jgi:flagellar protein FliS